MRIHNILHVLKALNTNNPNIFLKLFV